MSEFAVRMKFAGKESDFLVDSTKDAVLPAALQDRS